MNVMTGKLSNQLLIYREQLVSISSRLETIIDFSDEDLPDDVLNGYVNTIKELQNNINVLVSDSELSEQIRDGVKIALIGPVNAGKSTILNMLAKREVAIVSEIEGTTRDAIEVRLDLGGIPVILTDTAGIREADDFVEIEGIRRAKKVAAESDVTILVLDVSNPDWAEMLGEFEKWGSAIKLVVLNKSDLVTDNAIQQKIRHVNTPILKHAEPIIASFQNKITENSGDILVKKLAEILSYIPTSSSDLRLTRSWHKSACLSASAALERAMAIDIQQQPELVAEELRHACVSLGRLTGTVEAEDLLDNIFSNFCIGK
jgi:tRNA modification GTPase